MNILYEMADIDDRVGQQTLKGGLIYTKKHFIDPLIKSYIFKVWALRKCSLVNDVRNIILREERNNILKVIMKYCRLPESIYYVFENAPLGRVFSLVWNRKVINSPFTCYNLEYYEWPYMSFDLYMDDILKVKRYLSVGIDKQKRNIKLQYNMSSFDICLIERLKEYESSVLEWRNEHHIIKGLVRYMELSYH